MKDASRQAYQGQTKDRQVTTLWLPYSNAAFRLQVSPLFPHRQWMHLCDNVSIQLHRRALEWK